MALRLDSTLKKIPVFALVAAAAAPVQAVDGVVLIDQNKALAGSVTPGDAPGFPVTITQPGSYRLSSNLSPPSLATAIEIAVSNVTIDLNGFALLAVPHSIPPFDTGIRFTGTVPARGITIRNGVISNFTFPFNLGGTFTSSGFANGAEAVLEDLSFFLGDVLIGGSAGVSLGPYSRVSNVNARSTSLSITCPSLVTHSVFTSLNPEGARCTLINNATAF